MLVDVDARRGRNDEGPTITVTRQYTRFNEKRTRRMVCQLEAMLLLTASHVRQVDFSLLVHRPSQIYIAFQLVFPHVF